MSTVATICRWPSCNLEQVVGSIQHNNISSVPECSRISTILCGSRIEAIHTDHRSICRNLRHIVTRCIGYRLKVCPRIFGLVLAIQHICREACIVYSPYSRFQVNGPGFYRIVTAILYNIEITFVPAFNIAFRSEGDSISSCLADNVIVIHTFRIPNVSTRHNLELVASSKSSYQLIQTFFGLAWQQLVYIINCPIVHATDHKVLYIFWLGSRSVLNFYCPILISILSTTPCSCDGEYLARECFVIQINLEVVVCRALSNP